MRWLPNYVPLTLYTHTEIDQLVFETSTQKFQFITQRMANSKSSLAMVVTLTQSSE